MTINISQDLYGAGSHLTRLTKSSIHKVELGPFPSALPDAPEWVSFSSPSLLIHTKIRRIYPDEAYFREDVFFDVQNVAYRDDALLLAPTGIKFD